MKISALLISVMLSIAPLFSQTWSLEKAYPLDPEYTAWTTDEYGQLYQWKDKHLCVQNSQSGQVLRESFKSFGEISGVFPLNGLRIVLFSESQQQLAFIDNTLQLQGAALDLSELGFSYVSQVAKSSRPDYLWLFDQYRERLILFNINTAQAVQILDNCFGGIKDLQLVQFFEYQQNLICHLSDGRFFEFDRNLTLVKKLTLAQNLHLFGYQNELWQQEQNRIEKLSPSIYSSPIELPATNYQELQVLQDRFYFQQGQKISVYRLKL